MTELQKGDGLSPRLVRPLAIVGLILWYECATKFKWSVRSQVVAAVIIVAAGIAALLWRRRRRLHSSE
jgi:hypothetical protein